MVLKYFFLVPVTTRGPQTGNRAGGKCKNTFVVVKQKVKLEKQKVCQKHFVARLSDKSARFKRNVLSLRAGLPVGVWA
jgi:hypothetical protein